jgi:hypothetical protein
MQKLILFIVLIFILTVAFADQIYLSDGTVVKGTIIQITDARVEYKPEGGRAFDVVEKSAVVKVVYNDGRVVNYKLDTLYRRDGSAIKGIIKRVTPDDVVYVSEGSAQEKTIPRSEIERLEYSDGKTVYLAGGIAGGQRIIYEQMKPAGGFHDSVVRIAGFFGFGNPYRGVFEKERRVFNAFKPDLFMAYIVPRDYHLMQSYVNGGGELDLMPPAIRFPQQRSFDFTGIKFGIRGKYGYEYVDSLIVDQADYFYTVESYELYRGRLMCYHYWAAGPVMDLIFGPRSNSVNFILNFYAVAGQIFDGRLQPAAALRSAGFLAAELAGLYGAGQFLPGYSAAWISPHVNKTRFNGYTVRAGFGPHFSLNRNFPLVMGINVTYAYSQIRLGRDPFIYLDGNKKAALHEAGLEISAGLHF